MFYEIFMSNRKILLKLLQLKSISKKREKKHVLMFKVLKCI